MSSILLLMRIALPFLQLKKCVIWSNTLINICEIAFVHGGRELSLFSITLDLF